MRSAALAMLGLVCAGCADTKNGLSFQSNPLPMRLAGPAVADAGPTVTDATDDAASQQKTLASKVMSAIALEKVTGRKPDPGRLMQLD